jgi:hypothetical protein
MVAAATTMGTSWPTDRTWDLGWMSNSRIVDSTAAMEVSVKTANGTNTKLTGEG